MDGFVKFEGNRSRINTRLSLTRTNSLGIPTGFYRQQNISKYKYGVLFYNPTTQSIAVHFTNNRNEGGTFGVIHDSLGRGATLSITSFLKTYNIDPRVYSGKYEWKKGSIDNQQVFVFQLKRSENV